LARQAVPGELNMKVHFITFFLAPITSQILFGLAHSSVSRRVAIIRKKMALEQNFEKQVKAIKSRIKR